MKDTGLSEKELEQIRAVLRSVPAIEKSVLFGSRAMGLARGNSDVDIMLYGDTLSMGDVAHVRALLEETTLPYQFDLVLYDAENEKLQEHVRRYGKSMEGWPETTMGAVTKWLSGGTPPKDNPEYWGGTIPWISANSMHSVYIANSDLKLTNSGLQKSSRLVPHGTVLLLVRGSSLHSRIPVGITTHPVAFNQDVKAILPHKEELDSRYLLYWLMAKSSYLLGSVVEDTGIGAGKLDTARMLNLPFALPPLEIQRQIASFFGTLDDRIQLLRETNATLEAIAQALFKSWFLDFDPIHAKAEGRTPEGMDAETAALFPDKFEESELGMVPKGWKLFPFAEAYEINPRRKLQKDLPATYLDMSSVGVQGHSVADTIIRAVGSGTKFQNGDTLLARITPCLENGKTAFVDFLGKNEVGWGSTEFVVLRPKAPLPEYHGYLLARNRIFRAFAIQSMSGTSGRQRIQNDALACFPIVVPTDSVCMAFEKVVSFLQKKITTNHLQARTLADLRDTLLPRLISGKLRLPECVEPSTNTRA